MDFKEGNLADKAQVLSFTVNLKCSFSLYVCGGVLFVFNFLYILQTWDSSLVNLWKIMHKG